MDAAVAAHSPAARECGDARQLEHPGHHHAATRHPTQDPPRSGGTRRPERPGPLTGRPQVRRGSAAVATPGHHHAATAAHARATVERWPKHPDHSPTARRCGDAQQPQHRGPPTTPQPPPTHEPPPRGGTQWPERPGPLTGRPQVRRRTAAAALGTPPRRNRRPRTSHRHAAAPSGRSTAEPQPAPPTSRSPCGGRPVNSALRGVEMLPRVRRHPPPKHPGHRAPPGLTSRPTVTPAS